MFLAHFGDYQENMLHRNYLGQNNHDIKLSNRPMPVHCTVMLLHSGE